MIVGQELCTRVPNVGLPALINVRSRFSRMAPAYASCQNPGSSIRPGVVIAVTATLDLSTAERAPQTAARMAAAAQEFLAALNDQQRKAATLPFGDDRRYVWDYRPLESTPRNGLR